MSIFDKLQKLPGLRKTRGPAPDPTRPVPSDHGRPAPQDPGLGTDIFVRAQQGEFDQPITELFKNLDQNADNEHRLAAARGFIVALYENRGLKVSEERINEIIEIIKQRLPDVVVIRVESAKRSTTTFEPSAEVDEPAEVEA
jgi:hypothetical protein